HPDPAELAEACAAGDLAGAVEAAERIVGLGPGLTPSGDDILCGLLVSLRLVGDAVRHGRRAVWLADWLGAAVTADAGTRTTALAATLLHCAAAGGAGAEVAAVLRGVAGHEPPALPVRRLLAVGHTSGADLAQGVLAGCRAPQVRGGRSMRDWVEVRRGAYHDSVTLMRVSRALSERPGVAGAMVAMGTEVNREMVAGMGFEVPADAGPDDLIVAVRVADGAEGFDEVREALDGLLRDASRPPAGTGVLGAPPPARTTASAAARAEATVALLSVPGPHVFPEAMDALDAGLNVMIFSDNVPLSQEIALKEAAARRGLIVMGPDCGTAVIGGAGLGFANVVRPGPVGVVAASGTGAQQLMCLLDAAG